MASWSALFAPSQAGRTAIVTGANSGIGYHAAAGLAHTGAHVVLACRSEDRGRDALDRLKAAQPRADVELRLLDLADLDSVRDFAQAARDEYPELHLLVNNAGVMAIPRRETADGFEMQFGTNHLGHFALTGLLMPSLLAADDPRVVTVSSGAHRMGRIHFDDLQARRSYRRWRVYGQAKLANLLFALELKRRAEAAGTPLRSLAAHPGYAATNLQTQSGRMRGNRLDELANVALNKIVAQTDEQGALPTLYAATMDLPGGTYVGPNGPLELRGAPTVVQPASHARDEKTAARLWEVSEDLTGVKYEFAVKAPA
jgi:NAD(P)-dependent dehydrogenase (short-subunit alcohol dehydrogenase family)